MNAEQLIEQMKKHYKVSTISELANIIDVAQNTISSWISRDSIASIEKKCKEKEIYEKIFKEKYEKVDNKNLEIENIIADLLIICDEKEILRELQKIKIEKLIEKFEKTSSNVIIKFLNITGPNRTILFMYYIAQLIEIDYESNIKNYKEFLKNEIDNFPVWNLIINQPEFTEKIKKDFIETVEYKMSPDECKILVEEHKNIIEILEQQMPLYVIKAHKNKFKH